jgi:hypothetical protein
MSFNSPGVDLLTGMKDEWPSKGLAMSMYRLKLLVMFTDVYRPSLDAVAMEKCLSLHDKSTFTVSIVVHRLSLSHQLTSELFIVFSSLRKLIGMTVNRSLSFLNGLSLGRIGRRRPFDRHMPIRIERRRDLTSFNVPSGSWRLHESKAILAS